MVDKLNFTCWDTQYIILTPSQPVDLCDCGMLSSSYKYFTKQAHNLTLLTSTLDYPDIQSQFVIRELQSEENFQQQIQYYSSIILTQRGTVHVNLDFLDSHEDYD